MGANIIRLFGVQPNRTWIFALKTRILLGNTNIPFPYATEFCHEKTRRMISIRYSGEDYYRGNLKLISFSLASMNLKIL